MCCDLVGSVGSRQHWLWDIARKKEWICFENHSIAHNLGTTGPILVGFSAKCTCPNEHFNQNWKCHMSEFRLISIDHITYYNPWPHVGYSKRICCYLLNQSERVIYKFDEHPLYFALWWSYIYISAGLLTLEIDMCDCRGDRGELAPFFSTDAMFKSRITQHI